MFRTLIYPSSGACDYSVELPNWSYCSWFDVCWSFGVVGLEWYPWCSLLNYHIGRIVLGSMCVGVSVWLGWSGICDAGWSLQHGYHSKQTTPKLQHTSNQEQYDQCGNSTACITDTTPTQPHRNSNTHRTKNNTTNVVIQQNSRKLLMMDILMSETCWAHKKRNKIASDIKLVFNSSAIKEKVNCKLMWYKPELHLLFTLPILLIGTFTAFRY